MRAGFHPSQRELSGHSVWCCSPIARQQLGQEGWGMSSTPAPVTDYRRGTHSPHWQTELIRRRKLQHSSASSGSGDKSQTSFLKTDRKAGTSVPLFRQEKATKYTLNPRRFQGVYTLNSTQCQQKTPALFLSSCTSKSVMEQFGAFTVTSTFLSLHITTTAATWKTDSALSLLCCSHPMQLPLVESNRLLAWAHGWSNEFWEFQQEHTRRLHSCSPGIRLGFPVLWVSLWVVDICSSQWREKQKEQSYSVSEQSARALLWLFIPGMWQWLWALGHSY